MTRPRRLPKEHILLAGEAQDLGEICTFLDAMPDSAYGQVFIEALLPEDVRAIPAPPRVTVNWLVRSGQHSRVPSLVFADRGELLAQALQVWAGEWVVDDEAGPDRVWLGCGASPWMEHARVAFAGRPVYPACEPSDGSFASR